MRISFRPWYLLQRAVRLSQRRAALLIDTGSIPLARRPWSGLEAIEQRILLSTTDPAAQQAMEMFNLSPALFIENRGQWDDESVRFVHNGNGMNVAMTDSGPVFQLFRPGEVDEADRFAAQEVTFSPSSGDVIDQRFPYLGNLDQQTYPTPAPLTTPSRESQPMEMRQFSVGFVNATASSPLGLEQAETVFNYLRGSESQGRSEVPSFGVVAYEDLYEGIDLHTRGQRSNLKYEFRVAPGSDYTQVQLRYEGVEGLSIAEDGSLIINLGEGWDSLVDAAPYVYQELDGQRVEIESRYVLVDEVTYTFELGDYDITQPLIIDPELVWSTYVGGISTDRGYGIAVDGLGNIYVMGDTNWGGWATGGFDTSHNGQHDAFVAKINANGTLAWSSYLGGTNLDLGEGIAVDGSGNVYVTGFTNSSGWTSGGFDTSYNGGTYDAFVAKINANGTLAWSTYLGGNHQDFGNGIAVDGSGNVYVTGYTDSSGWTSGGFDTSYNGGTYDAFVGKINANGTLAWSSYLGGTVWDLGYSIAMDGSGNVYVTGYTDSSGWTSGGLDTSHNGLRDAFVAKINANGTLAWSSYMGGSNSDYAYGIAVDGSGNIVVVGSTGSNNWVSGGFDTSYNGGGDVFVAKINANGTLVWSSYLGGTDSDAGRSIAVDGSGNVYVTGYTASSGWTSGGFDTSYSGGDDVFVAKINANGTLVWSSYLGGTDQDLGEGIAVDGSGNVYVTGETLSSGWVSGGFDISHNGANDAFVAKINANGTPTSIGQWSTSVLSQARRGLTATTVGTKAIFAGGFAGAGNPSNVVDIYDSSTGQWSTSVLSQARSSLAATTAGAKAIFAGGYAAGPSNVVDLRDAVTNQWSTAVLSQARWGLAATTVGTKAILAGGFAGDSNPSNVVDIYDADTGLWSTAVLSQARASLAATTVGTKAIFAGGNDGDASNVVDIYDSVTGLWSTATLSQRRWGLAATTVGTKAIFAGGGSDAVGYSNVVDIYDSITGLWTTAVLSQGRQEMGATTVGTQAIFAGGRPDNVSNSSDMVDIYDGGTGQWSTASLSQARASLAATTVGTQAIFAGGYAGSGLVVSNAVDIYDTSTDVIAPTTYAITPKPATVTEGNTTLTFTVTRSGGLPSETVYFSTVHGAIHGYADNTGNSDYVGVLNHPLVFAANATSLQVAVQIKDDTLVEGNETFGVIVQRNSSDPPTTYLDKSTFTITDNDTPTTYAISPNPATVNEDAGTLTFTITRAGGLPAETVYASTTTGEDSSNNSDYTSILNQAVSFTSGQTSRTVTVSITNDTAAESSETFGFIVQRTGGNEPASSYLAKSTFTITDNEPATVAPNPPTGVSASDDLTDKVRVTWSVADGATAYEVWRSTSPTSGSASKISSSDVTGLSYDDTSAVAETQYYYWVKAKNTAGPSNFSASDAGKRVAAPPADTDDRLTTATALGSMTKRYVEEDSISSATDVDMYSFTVTQGQRVGFKVDVLSGGLSPYIRLFTHPTGAAVPSFSGSTDSYVEYTFSTGGTYYVGVSSASNKTYDPQTGGNDTSGGATGEYKLTLSAWITNGAAVGTEERFDIQRYTPLGLNSAAIDPTAETWLIIHGRITGREDFYDLASAVLDAREDKPAQVLTLDWSGAAAASGELDFSGEAWIEHVAIWAAPALSTYGFQTGNLNLVGHSWGANVAAEIAALYTGGVNTIIALDPAENAITNVPIPGVIGSSYNPDISVVFGGSHSKFSWAFYASDLDVKGVTVPGLGIPGNETTPGTAHEAFVVDNTNHSTVVKFFENLLRAKGTGKVSSLFTLDRLLDRKPGPWLPNQYDYNGVQAFSGQTLPYEAVITADATNTSVKSIKYTKFNNGFDSGLETFKALVGNAQVIAPTAERRVVQLTEGSDAAIGQQLTLPADAATLHFDYHFTMPGIGDRLVARINGVELWSMLGTDYDGTDLQPSGPIDISAYAGTTVDLEVRLSTVEPSTGEGKAQVWVDNIAILAAAPESVEPPVITSLTASAGTVTQGQNLTLTANGVSDPDGAVVAVQFYRDSNGNDALDVDVDALLGLDEDGNDGWTWTGSTAAFAVGNNRLFARAKDDSDLYSSGVGVTKAISAAPPPEVSVSYGGIIVSDGHVTPTNGDGTDFGSITQGGAVVSRTFTVRNTGTGTLLTSNLTVPDGFTVTEGLLASIDPSGSDTFTVRLDNTAAGVKSGQISFVTNDTDENPFNFSVTGTVNAALVPEVEVLGNDVVVADEDVTPSVDDHTDFGVTTVGGAVVSRTFTVRNTGTAALTTSNLTLPTGFTLIEGLAGSIAPDGNDTFTVQLDNAVAGVKGGQISFVTNDSDENPYNFAISGTVNVALVPEVEVRGNGVVIQDADAAPSSGDHTDFGAITQGGAVVSRTFTVRNTGTAVLTTVNLTVPGGFTVTEPLSASIAPNEEDTFTVRLDSTTAGTKSGQISFSSNDSDESPYNFSITGTVNAPEVEVQGNNVVLVDGDVTPSVDDHTDFGAITVAEAVVNRTFTVRNTGTAALTTSNLTLPTGFTLVEGLAVSIDPGGSDTFTVQLDSTAIGTKSGQVSFSSNDADESPYNFTITGVVNAALVPEVELRGNGIVIVDGDGTPSAGDHTDFGSINHGGSTVSRTFTVFNTGTATLTTSGLTVPPGYTVTEGLSSSIAAGGNDTFTVQLDSTVAGTKSGQISFSNNDSDENPHNFSITGVVNAPKMEVQGNSLTIVDEDTTPSLLDHTEFGSGTLGGVVVSRTFVVLNTGTAVLTTSDLTVPTGFTITEGLAASIPAGGSDTFTVQLDNAPLGVKGGQITFNTNDPAAGGFGFAVAGTVMPPPVTISEANKTFVVPYTNIKVSLKGVGTATIWAGLDGSIDGIELTGSNSKSSLTITPVNKGETGRVGEIVVGDPSNPNDRTSLGSLAGKSVQLTEGLTITGGIKTLTLASATNAAIVIGSASDIVSSTMTVGTLSGVTINTATPIKTIKTNSWTDSGAVASLTAPWIGTMSVQGVMEADLTATGQGPGSSLKKLTVAGALRNVTLRAVGNIGAVTVGSVIGSRVLAGVRSDLTGNPSSAGDFTGDFAISSFTSKGEFSDSVLAAARVTKVSLGSVNTANEGNKFGVYAREAPKSFKRGDAAKGYKLTPVVTMPSDIEPIGTDDFEVRVL